MNVTEILFIHIGLSSNTGELSPLIQYVTLGFIIQLGLCGKFSDDHHDLIVLDSDFKRIVETKKILHTKLPLHFVFGLVQLLEAKKKVRIFEGQYRCCLKYGEISGSRECFLTAIRPGPRSSIWFCTLQSFL